MSDFSTGWPWELQSLGAELDVRIMNMPISVVLPLQIQRLDKLTSFIFVAP